MPTANDDPLLDSAGAIADGAGVEWTGGSNPDPALARRLESLHRIGRVAAAWRSVTPAPLEAPLASEAPGPAFLWGDLEALEKLGEGSFGEVWRAWDAALQREVALKLRRAGGDDASARRDLDEARRLARVRHPNVVQVHGVATHDGRPGFWSELVRGRTLEQRLIEQGPFAADEAALIGMELCRALAAVHAVGLVHGDIKTTNVMREDGGRLVLMDFGSGRELTASGSAGPLTGTPLCIAPEVLAGASPSVRSDLYALGVLLFRLVTGRHPVEATSLDALRERHARGERVSLRAARPDLSSPFVAVVERLLERHASDRFADAGALEQALAASLGEGRAGRVPEAPSAPLAPGRTRTPWRRLAPLAWAAASLLAISVVIVVRSRLAPSADATQSLPPASSSLPRATPIAETPERVTRPAAKPPIASPGSSPLAQADLVRYREGGREVLDEHVSISPGDHLGLEFHADEPLHVYVFNEDDQGEVFALFPVQGTDLANPLPARRRHRLPGRRDGAPFDWVVTSSGGRERVLVVASRQPLAPLDREVAALPAASPERPVAYARVGDDAIALLRGIGGMGTSPSPAPREGRLDALWRDLREKPGAVWVRRFVIDNP